MERFDVAVIGGGPGGYVAAIRAAQLGRTVALVDRSPVLGGTCLNVGCIPSKALLEASEFVHLVRHGGAVHGVRVGDVSFDLGEMMARKQQVVRELTDGIAQLMKRNKVRVLVGTGDVPEPGRVQVSTGEGKVEFGADAIVLATGSLPVELPFMRFDGQRVIDSTTALSLTAVPRHLVVVGGGAVGLELGSVWRRLGAEVTVVEMMKQITPFADQQAAKALERSLKKQGMAFKLRTTVTAADLGDGEVELTLEDSKGRSAALNADKVLVAVGRRPHHGGIDLEGLGVRIDDRGRALVDDNLRTGVPGLYAIGDLVPGPMLAHKAEQEAVSVAEVIAGGHANVDYDVIPSVVYTDPELAAVGATEQQLKAQGIEYTTGRFQYRANGRAKSMAAEDGMAKVLASASNGRLLGVQIVGARASEMIGEAVIAMSRGATAAQLGHAVHAHPTLSEILKEAALAASDGAIHA
jgi:dihydrolipoamide dehydrogenase